MSATARLAKGGKATVARLLRVSGRHAERLPDQQVHGVTPRAVEFNEQWAVVKKSKGAVERLHPQRPVTSGIIVPWRLTAS